MVQYHEREIDVLGEGAAVPHLHAGDRERQAPVVAQDVAECGVRLDVRRPRAGLERRQTIREGDPAGRHGAHGPLESAVRARRRWNGRPLCEAHVVGDDVGNVEAIEEVFHID